MFNDSYWWPAIIHIIRLCNTCYKIVLHYLCYQQMLIFIHSALFPGLYAIIFVWKRNPVIVRTILYVWKCYHMVRSVTKNKNDRTHISFYIWISYTSYIVCISIVKCWWLSIYDDLGSTVCILTTNFDSRRYKPISLSCYVTYITQLISCITSMLTVECWRFVSKS